MSTLYNIEKRILPTNESTDEMEQRFFPNPFDDYKGQNVAIDTSHIRTLIKNYVQTILDNTKGNQSKDSRGDLYVGDAGE